MTYATSYTESDMNDAIETLTKLCDAVDVKQLAEALIRQAADQGLILTIEQVPLLPLAMGHHRSVVTVRQARKLGT